jgi:hypothetical protein
MKSEKSNRLESFECKILPVSIGEKRKDGSYLNDKSILKKKSIKQITPVNSSGEPIPPEFRNSDKTFDAFLMKSIDQLTSSTAANSTTSTKQIDNIKASLINRNINTINDLLLRAEESDDVYEKCKLRGNKPVDCTLTLYKDLRGKRSSYIDKLADILGISTVDCLDIV